MQRKILKPIKFKKIVFYLLKKKIKVVTPQIFNSGFVPRN